MNIVKIKELALVKKEELKNNGENLDKINNILDFLEDEMCFFKVDINLSIPILLYIGIKEDDVVDVYFKLISAVNYKEKCQVRKGIEI